MLIINEGVFQSMAQIESSHNNLSNLFQSIDDSTMKNLMQYFQFEDFDELLRYAIALGVCLLPEIDSFPNPTS